jgi:hypothetical protein
MDYRCHEPVGSDYLSWAVLARSVGRNPMTGLRQYSLLIGVKGDARPLSKSRDHSQPVGGQSVSDGLHIRDVPARVRSWLAPARQSKDADRILGSAVQSQILGEAGGSPRIIIKENEFALSCC